jgi:hypothetical protein
MFALSWNVCYTKLKKLATDKQSNLILKIGKLITKKVFYKFSY